MTAGKKERDCREREEGKRVVTAGKDGRDGRACVPLTDLVIGGV